MADPAARARLDAHWASFFGIEIGALRSQRPLVVAHAGALGGYRGIYAQAFGAAPVISVPADRLAAWASVPPGLDVEDPEPWRDLVPDLERIIGPAWIGYRDQPPAASSSCRTLAATDQALVDALRSRCTETEWDHGGFSDWSHPVIGVVEDGALAAVGNYEIWGDLIAHLSIVTDPARRGRGHARAIITELTRIALARDLMPQYRSLIENSASLATAASCGFTHYATSLALRIRSTQP